MSLTTWTTNLIAGGGAVLTLAGIFGIGFKVGQRERNRSLETEIDQIKELLKTARDQQERERQQASLWRSRYEEIAPKVSAEGRAVQNKLDDVRNFVSDPDSIWSRKPAELFFPRSPRTGGVPILTVGNLKGGVGKSTIATHIAAGLGMRGKNTLFLDLDYQGSGSAFLIRAADPTTKLDRIERNAAAWFLRHAPDPTILANLPVRLGKTVPNVSVVPAHYPLADEEESLMLRWVLGDEPTDIRFNLSKILQSERLKYDVVVIDAAPRMTTAMVQAIAASTHLLIPVELEQKSTEAAVYFDASIKKLREVGIGRDLELIGVLPNKLPRAGTGEDTNRTQMKYLKDNFGTAPNGKSYVWEAEAIYDRIHFKDSRLVSDQGATAREANDMMQLVISRTAERLWA